MKGEYQLTKVGYQKALEKLEKLKEQYNENEKAMSKSIAEATGDGPHDNGEFEALQAKEKLLVGQINTLMKQLESASIIEIPELEANKVNIGDVVLLRLIYAPDEIEEVTYQLVGEDGDVDKGQISINSPLGRAIFKEAIGSKVTFIPQEEIYYAEILDKIT